MASLSVFDSAAQLATARALQEIIVPATWNSEFDHVTADWASKWPSAELWKASKIERPMPGRRRLAGLSGSE